MEFLGNFNPETSEREKRKQNRKNYSDNPKKKTAHDAKGHFTETGQNLCDCLNEKCPGCHFPCPKCNSNKCGLSCRVNRKWMVEEIKVEGTDGVIKNKFYTKTK